MATAPIKEVYCSAILNNGMEYMLVAPDGWESMPMLKGGVFKASTLDGNPIVLSLVNVIVLREVSDAEYKLWKESLEKYREDKLKEAQVTNLSVN